MERKKLGTRDIAYIGVSAALIAVCAFITVPIGAVPVTLQTLGVFVVAGLLGFKRSSVSVCVYILLGAIGLPVFSGFKGGIGVLLGATGGYIIGFVFIALITGLTSDKTKKLYALALSMIAGCAVCYAFGTAWFMLVFSKDVTLSQALKMCVIPFIPFDLIKIAAAAVLVNRLGDKILK